MSLLYLVLGGAVAGFYGSAAGGGGLVSFPLLVLLGFSTPVAVATNRFAAIILESVSALRFFREGALLPSDIRLALLLGLTAAAGSALGALVVVNATIELVNVLTGGTLLLMTVYLLFRKPLAEKKERMLTRARIGFLHGVMFLLGVYGGILGAGMGTLFSVLLVGSGLTFLHASAIARFSGIIWSLSPTVVFALNGSIDWAAGLALGVGFSAGGWIGAGVGVRKGERYIRFLLLAVIFASIVKLIAGAIG